MSDEFYEAFEEWAVMTVDGNVDDIIALKYIKKVESDWQKHKQMQRVRDSFCGDV